MTVRFYYFSSISWLVYFVATVVGIMLLSLLWTRLLKLKVTNPVYWLLVAGILVGPWAEELWIARNFDQLCRKDAGVFVNKVVEVEGYYNDTGLPTRIVGGPSYKFIEGRDRDGKFSRIERASEEERTAAIAWYTKKRGKQPDEAEWITYPVSQTVHVTVEMNTRYAWRITRLDRPTARYQFRRLNSHTPVSHQIKRFEDVVIDSKDGEVLGRYTNYYRGPYWFFISLDIPTIPCKETEVATRQYGSLIYLSVLKPSR